MSAGGRVYRPAPPLSSSWVGRVIGGRSVLDRRGLATRGLRAACGRPARIRRAASVTAVGVAGRLGSDRERVVQERVRARPVSAQPAGDRRSRGVRSAAASACSASAVASRRARSARATSSGSWLIGVAVTTRVPKAPSRNSTSTTRLAGSTRSSWPAQHAEHAAGVRPAGVVVRRVGPQVQHPGDGQRRARRRRPAAGRGRSGCGCWRSRCTAQPTSSSGGSPPRALPIEQPQQAGDQPRPSEPAAANQTAIAEITAEGEHGQAGAVAAVRRVELAGGGGVATDRAGQRCRPTVPSGEPEPGEQPADDGQRRLAGAAVGVPGRRAGGRTRPACRPAPGGAARTAAGACAAGCRVLVRWVAAT